jgi:hypothetical protein
MLERLRKRDKPDLRLNKIDLKMADENATKFLKFSYPLPHRIPSPNFPPPPRTQ